MMSMSPDGLFLSTLAGCHCLSVNLIVELIVRDLGVQELFVQ
jgi:uncharacterized OsmC-like protein